MIEYYIKARMSDNRIWTMTTTAYSALGAMEEFTQFHRKNNREIVMVRRVSTVNSILREISPLILSHMEAI